MNTKTRILLSLGAAVLAAALGAFWFWSMGCKWEPGEKLGMATGFCIFSAICVGVLVFAIPVKDKSP